MRTYADICERQNRIGSAHSRQVYFNGANHSMGMSGQISGGVLQSNPVQQI